MQKVLRHVLREKANATNRLAAGAKNALNKVNCPIAESCTHGRKCGIKDVAEYCSLLRDKNPEEYLKALEENKNVTPPPPPPILKSKYTNGKPAYFARPFLRCHLHKAHITRLLSAPLLFFLVTSVAIISPRCKPDQSHPTNIESTGRSKKVGSTDFKGYLSSKIEGLKSDRISDISVYYYDLTKDSGFGVDENELYIPASLGKVPVMIALLKMAETNNTFLDQKLKIPDSLKKEFMPNITPEEQAEPGHAYSIDALIKYMIVYSDNAASDVLKNYLFTFADQPLYRVYSFLHFPLSHRDANYEEIFSPKRYANAFIALFKSSYLSSGLSEKALALLKQSEFSQGLLAGVPPGIAVADKFGERGYTNTRKKSCTIAGSFIVRKGPMSCA